MSGIKYRSQCLNDAKKCNENESLAAVMDYVGATRGELGQVHFNGKLTPSERAYVEKKFGILPETSPEAIDTYLSNANSIYIQDYIAKWKESNPDNGAQDPFSNRKACQKEQGFSVQKYQHSKLGWGEALGGWHFCAEKYAQMYIAQGSELDIAANPKNYQFFIEGSQYTQTHEKKVGKALEKPIEIEFFKRIANELKIPIHEATPFNSSHLSSIRLASKTNAVPEMEYLAVVLIKRFYSPAVHLHNLAYEMSQKGQGIKLDWNKLWEETLVALAKEYSLDSEQQSQLKQTLLNFVGQGSRLDGKILIAPTSLAGPSGEPKQIAEKTEKRFNELIAASNALSVEVIQHQLQASGREKSVFIIGNGHHPLVASVYQENAGNKVLGYLAQSAVRSAQATFKQVQSITSGVSSLVHYLVKK